MSIISGVKHAPSKNSSLKKTEKLPQFGVKTEREQELANVSKVFHYALKSEKSAILECRECLRPLVINPIFSLIIFSNTFCLQLYGIYSMMRLNFFSTQTLVRRGNACDIGIKSK